jgi:NTE family protein
MQTTRRTSYRIGLALGSGASRGWAHVGVLQALDEMGIRPDIVCGCSIGALVGAAYSSGRLDALYQWISTLTRLDVARFLELNLSFNGFVDTDRLEDFLRRHVFEQEARIEDLQTKYAAVATDLETGREVWFTKGPVLQAVWPSIAMPGLFPPVQHEDRWLVDGGLVNPVPVSLCRALGADLVLAVNLNGDILGKHLDQKQQPVESSGFVSQLRRTVKKYSPALFPDEHADYDPPALLSSMAASINILQDRVTRSRMAGDPPDLLLAPRLSHLGLLEFHRVSEAVDEGRACVDRARSELQRLFVQD